MDSVIVLGAGLAGLGCARELPGCRVFEAAAQVGGHASSHSLGGAWFDQGAHICHSKDADFLAMVRAAAGRVHGIAPSVVHNYWQGAWLTYPVQNNLHELPLPLRSQALVDLIDAHVGRDADGHGDQANYRAWCLAQYGRTLTEQFYDVFTAKYWRVPAAELATDWLSGRLVPSQLPRIIQGAFGPESEEQTVFARFHYPAHGGFFGFFRALYAGLPIACGEGAVELDVRRKQVVFAGGRREPFDALASSIPLTALVSITRGVPAELRDAAAKLRATQLLCVNLVVARPRLRACHWCYIYDPEIEAARVSFPSNLAPGTLPDDCTALQAEIFRGPDEEVPEDALVETTVRQMAKLFHFDAGEVRAVGHLFVPRAYVISDHRRAAAVAAIRGWFEEHGVYTMGLYGRWKYVWSDEAYRQGRQTALQIRERCRVSRKSA
jgi:protoporphyrinogen oxidase